MYTWGLPHRRWRDLPRKTMGISACRNERHMGEPGIGPQPSQEDGNVEKLVDEVHRMVGFLWFPMTHTSNSGPWESHDYGSLCFQSPVEHVQPRVQHDQLLNITSRVLSTINPLAKWSEWILEKNIKKSNLKHPVASASPTATHPVASSAQNWMTGNFSPEAPFNLMVKTQGFRLRFSLQPIHWHQHPPVISRTSIERWTNCWRRMSGARCILSLVSMRCWCSTAGASRWARFWKFGWGKLEPGKMTLQKTPEIQTFEVSWTFPCTFQAKTMRKNRVKRSFYSQDDEVFSLIKSWAPMLNCQGLSGVDGLEPKFGAFGTEVLGGLDTGPATKKGGEFRAELQVPCFSL